MVWHIIKRLENEKGIDIGYSSGTSDLCDGIIRFDKENRELLIIKMSESSDKFDTNWLLPHIFTALRRNEVTDSISTIAIG